MQNKPIGEGKVKYTKQLSENEQLSDRQYEQISRLIYETDSYIYPALFAGSVTPEESVRRLLPAVLKNGTDEMFRRDNLFVCFDGQIVRGIILWKKGRLSWNEKEFMKIASQQNVILIPENVHAVKSNYLDECYSECETDDLLPLSIINVCVDRDCRGQGTGYFMFGDFVHLHETDNMELHVLKDNDTAVKLYRQYRFDIISESSGFSMDENKPRVYKMFRPRKI